MQVVLFTAVRLIVNISTRMIYPFLNAFASGLGVDLAAVSLALTARSFTGALSPFITPIADKRGRKLSMLIGLGLFTLGTGLMVFWPCYTSFFISVNLSFLGMYVYVPSMQSYLGDHVRDSKRGLALALVEWGWAFSFILGMPLVGWVMDRYGWQAPFPLLGAAGVLSLFLIAWLIPNQLPPASDSASFWGNLKQVLRSPAARAALLVSLLLLAANEVINLVFGAWLEQSFGFKLAALGAASALIGLSEMGGEISGGVLSDRFGRKKAILLGMCLIVAVSAALPFIGRTSFGAIAGLFLFYLAFEFADIAIISMMNNLIPEARATLMGANVAAMSLGRMVGNLMAPFLFAVGFWLNSVAAIVLTLLALVALTRIKEKAG
jgi:predicted MFS family arabinose efflux permease